jgi:hypothetical protein
VGGLPKDLQFELIEPLRELFKDEVRTMGRLLGVPEVLLHFYMSFLLSALLGRISAGAVVPFECDFVSSWFPLL